MAPSADAMSKSTFLVPQGTLLVLDSLKQMRADLNRANDVFALIQEMVLAYCSPFFSAISNDYINNNNNNSNNINYH